MGPAAHPATPQGCPFGALKFLPPRPVAHLARRRAVGRIERVGEAKTGRLSVVEAATELDRDEVVLDHGLDVARRLGRLGAIDLRRERLDAGVRAERADVRVLEVVLQVLSAELQVGVVGHLRLHVELVRAGGEVLTAVHAVDQAGIRDAVTAGDTRRRAQEVLVEVGAEERPRDARAQEVRAGGALEVGLAEAQLHVAAAEALLERGDEHLAVVAHRGLHQVLREPIAAVGQHLQRVGAVVHQGQRVATVVVVQAAVVPTRRALRAHARELDGRVGQRQERQLADHLRILVATVALPPAGQVTLRRRQRVAVHDRGVRGIHVVVELAGPTRPGSAPGRKWHTGPCCSCPGSDPTGSR